MAAIQRIPCGYMFISYMADQQKQNIGCKIKRKVYSKLSFLFFTIVNISSNTVLCTTLPLLLFFQVFPVLQWCRRYYRLQDQCQ